MGLENMKKYSIVDRLQKLKSLQEGKVVDVSEDVDIQTSEVSTELPKNAKVEKEDKQSFEDYKTMYKDVITQKCIEDYGTEMDKQLWEDTAKELYLKSKTYIPTGEEKPEEVLDKKEEGYSNIRQISQAEKILLDIIKSVGDYSLQDVVCETTQTGDIHIMTKDGRDITTVDRSIFAIDGDDTELIDELREDGYWKEDFDESKNLKEDLSDKSKFLIHILNGVISDIQDKYNVTATAEFDTANTDNVIVTLKGNTLDLIDATSYLAKSIRRDDVDFNFDDTIKDNTVKCTISPKTKMESKVEDFSPEEKDIGEDFINFCDDLNLDNNSEEAKEKYLKQYTINEVEMNGIKDLENKLKMVRNAINYPKNKKVENNTNLEYNYMLLDRLKQDCEYFLGNGNGNVDTLWAKDIDEQIAKMKELYNSFADDEKPEWITMDDINDYEKEMKEYNKEKKTEITERDLSKDLYQDEANRRIHTRLEFLDVYLEELEKALKNNDTDSIISNKSRIKSNVAYLIPALNIKGSVNGLIDYLKTTDFDFENSFKETADLLKDLNNEDKKEESAVSDYTLSEIKKIIDSNGNDFTIKIVDSNEDVETKTLNIDRDDLINIYNVLGNNKITENKITESLTEKDDIIKSIQNCYDEEQLEDVIYSIGDEKLSDILMENALDLKSEMENSKSFNKMKTYKQNLVNVVIDYFEDPDMFE